MRDSCDNGRKVSPCPNCGSATDPCECRFRDERELLDNLVEAIDEELDKGKEAQTSYRSPIVFGRPTGDDPDPVKECVVCLEKLYGGPLPTPEPRLSWFGYIRWRDKPDEEERSINMIRYASNLRQWAKDRLAALTGEVKGCRHSDCFRSVLWSGTEYAFTEQQATAVRVLWEHWERGTPDVSGQYLLEAAESNSGRVDLLFRDHPAWKTMIHPGRTKGTYRLTLPGN